MTRKDYIRIAAALEDCKPVVIGRCTDEQAARLVQWAACCDSLCDALHDENDRFNAHKFMVACGIETKKQGRDVS